jgi:transcription termination/antitermination protein NusG
MECFLPLYRSIHRWKNGCKAQVELPVFPGYLFVKIRGSEWLRALDAPGVLSFVGSRQRPSQLDDFEIETLKSGLHLHRFEPHSRLTVGERVLIIAGPLSGLGGILLRNKNGIRVVITLELIHQSVAVELNVEDVEPLAQRAADLCERTKN